MISFAMLDIINAVEYNTKMNLWRSDVLNTVSYLFRINNTCWKQDKSIFNI